MTATPSRNKDYCRSDRATYLLLDRLGEGGFGQVYKAKVWKLARQTDWLCGQGLTVGDIVVVKWANLSEKYSAQEQHEFLVNVNEAIQKEVLGLQHLIDVPQAARIYDQGQRDVTLTDGTRQGAQFLVEELIAGRDFEKLLEEEFGKKKNGKSSFQGIQEAATFFDYAIKITDALRIIHQHGVIHGDIWARNVAVDKAGNVRFFDFGASAVTSTAAQKAHRLDRHRRDGYCAPERRSGGRHGRRSDIYSLGGLFYYMATGNHPPARLPSNIDRLKKKVVRAIQAKQVQLIKGNCGIADIIARCLRGCSRIVIRPPTDAQASRRERS